MVEDSLKGTSTTIFASSATYSSLNAQNNVEAFFETFEGVARVGQQSLKITNTICVSGHSSLPVDVPCPTLGS